MDERNVYLGRAKGNEAAHVHPVVIAVDGPAGNPACRHCEYQTRPIPEEFIAKAQAAFEEAKRRVEESVESVRRMQLKERDDHTARLAWKMLYEGVYYAHSQAHFMNFRRWQDEAIAFINEHPYERRVEEDRKEIQRDLRED